MLGAEKWQVLGFHGGDSWEWLRLELNELWVLPLEEQALLIGDFYGMMMSLVATNFLSFLWNNELQFRETKIEIVKQKFIEVERALGTLSS